MPAPTAALITGSAPGALTRCIERARVHEPDSGVHPSGPRRASRDVRPRVCRQRADAEQQGQEECEKGHSADSRNEGGHRVDLSLIHI